MQNCLAHIYCTIIFDLWTCASFRMAIWTFYDTAESMHFVVEAEQMPTPKPIPTNNVNTHDTTHVHTPIV